MRSSIALFLLILAFGNAFSTASKKETNILIFSKNAKWAYRHQSIEFANQSIKKYCEERGYKVEISEDASLFNDNTLQKFAAIVLVSANQDIFDADQEAALQRYIRAGGGLVGIHSSSGVERNWTWFSDMLGATFQWHPVQQNATINVIDKKHPSTKHLPTKWQRWDEWYYFKKINPKVKVLLTLDSTTFKSDKHTQNYPNAWYHEFEGGRVFYTAGGHNENDFIDPKFIEHIFGGIKYAIGKNKMDYSKNKKFEKKPARIITLDPGHFHAALVQKTSLPNVNSEVKVYSPGGADLIQHNQRINNYNNRKENPTNWIQKEYIGQDFFEKMISEKNGDLVVMSGNNALKTDYILKTIESGMNVLADKPMCIDTEGYKKLQLAFEIAKKKGVLLYDIMTERSEITTVLQKELSQMPEVFGNLLPGSPQDPSIIKESIHHFFKFVSGSPLIRPQWFMDTKQQGEGIVDVTTHLVDLVHWAAYPETPLQISDAEVIAAKRWPTLMSLDQFSKITGAEKYPDFLQKNVTKDNNLEVYANGEIDFKLRKTHAKVKVLWNYSSEKGGDTHYSIMKGSKSNLEIEQGEKENFVPQLYIRNFSGTKAELQNVEIKLAKMFPGVSITKNQNDYLVVIPEKYRTGHEAHFGEVMERYLKFYKVNNMPDWEVPNMLLKYYITTQALEMAQK
jgi:type 1 glutamine amidotransferase/predicted dehydrogenase